MSGVSFEAVLARFQSMADGTVRLVIDTSEPDRDAILDACKWMAAAEVYLAVTIMPADVARDLALNLARGGDA